MIGRLRRSLIGDCARSRSAVGFVLIELLLVLIVIAILAGGYFARNSQKNEQSLYQTSLSRSGDAACKANRMALRNQIEMFRMSHANEAITSENLQKAGLSVPSCPSGGAYGFKKDGTIVCSKHPD